MTAGRIITVALGVCLSAGCEAPAEPVSQPEAWDQDVALPLVEDLNPDPNVLEVNLDARLGMVQIKPGVQTETWTYNGSVPGPLLRAKRGDRVIVHFTNHLPEATTVHWHGLQITADMDGSNAVQSPVMPGASFTYDFVLPDSGTFWYHPHMNSSSQVGYGLYGPLVVDDPADPLAVDDVVLMFSDMSLTKDGQLQAGDESGWFGDYFGREGAALLINGKLRPGLKARVGLPQRWRIINAARARFLKMKVPGTPLVRVGSDVGLMEHPQTLDSLLLAPSERAEVIFTPPASAAEGFAVMYQDPNRFGIGAIHPDEPLINLQMVKGGGAPMKLPNPLRVLPARDLTNAHHRRIELGEKVIDGVGYLTINGQTFGGEEGHHEAHAEPMHLAYVGDTEIWEVVNGTKYDHPFHLHGFAFEILDLDGKPWPVRELKDSVNVPAGETLRFVVTFDDRPGMWMFHCHILDHAQLGMMAVLQVRKRP